MSTLPDLPQESADYVRIWRIVLKAWLNWSDARISRFTQRWEKFMRAESGFFYNDLPFQYLSHLLLSPDMRRRFEGAKRLDIQNELDGAVTTGDCFAHLRPDYDWDAARARVELVLARYGGALPRPEDPAWEEEQDN